MQERDKVFHQKLKTFLNDSEGATAVEYAIMLALIIITTIGAIVVFGGENGALWGNTMDAVENAVNQ